MSESRFFLIVFDDIDTTQQNLIHSQIKDQAEDWWHRMPNVWIVKSDMSTSDWRESLKPFIPQDQPGELLILALPQEGRRQWSGYMQTSKYDWLSRVYARSRGDRTTGGASDLPVRP